MFIEKENKFLIEFLKIWAKKSWEFLKFICFLLGTIKLGEEFLFGGTDLVIEYGVRLLFYSFILSLLEIYRRKKYKR